MDKNLSINVFSLRKTYPEKKIERASLENSPTLQFKKWLDDAIKSNIDEPNAMVLSTSTCSGIPSSRVVLLKSFNSKGFLFFTNYHSNKSKDLNENPNACLCFFWSKLNRQVIISGSVKKTSRQISHQYFKTRPLEHQIGAWASKQSATIPGGRKALISRYKELEHLYKSKHKSVPTPPFWGGYRLIPVSFSFWQGSPSRLHKRFLYKKKNLSWTIEEIYP